MKTSHSWVQTPPKQSDSSSISVQQQDVEYSQAKGTQTIVASINQAKQRPGVPVIERNQQNSNSARLVGPSSTRLGNEAQKTVTVDLASISDPSEKASDTTCVQMNFENRRALELGNLVNQAREKGQQRQKHADEPRSFDLKRQEAELLLSQLTEEMNKHMVKLSGLHRNLERLHSQVAELDNKVKAVRQQADRTRDTANRVTLECRAYAESKRKAEKKFANTDEEMKQLVQALGIS
jgi:outer membrane murein-binding lipoprotein Lpp